DGLIQATNAERGFILFYLPESSEADVVAARNFQTHNLSLNEYDFSRTLLRQIFRTGSSLVVEDASQDPAYSKEASVIEFQMKSVLVVPLKQGERTAGALYLENNTLPRAFDREDQQLVETAAQFAVFYLQHARLLPAMLSRHNRVFLDANKASREIVGEHPKILEVLDLVSRIAESPATVLIQGESGTGKELVARALHYQSARCNRSFVAINCAAIPDNLLESELFGHERGAFTGASERYVGRIEQGSGGTIFLDEINELAYPLQAKMLRFLQSNELDRLGGKETVHVDVRVIAATSKDLRAMIAAGQFQEALYYRLNVIPITIPPLRERPQDVASLIDHFLEKYSAVYGRKVVVEHEVYEWLRQCPFPGNVRELENLIHRLVALTTDEVIRIGDLPKDVLGTRSQRVSLEKDPLYLLLNTPVSDLDDLRHRRKELRRALNDQEQQLFERVIAEADGNLTRAAARLGMHRITLHKMLRKGSSRTN
ncbi:MAG TPA: sigma 54-interacting transcriptional regulator, partial [Pyrinomonadaceae bacterium]|nr:sigma 54-interacting transcriptional regulator [Pyrinomonadaceae bacterium]